MGNKCAGKTKNMKLGKTNAQKLACNVCTFICIPNVYKPLLISFNTTLNAPGGFDVVEKKVQNGHLSVMHYMF